jgi:hypothetical protein
MLGVIMTKKKSNVVSLEQAMADLENSNLTYTIDGEPIILGQIVPFVTDRLGTTTFCNDGSIFIDGCGLFPTEELLLKMKKHIVNMLDNYDCFHKEFESMRLDFLRKELAEQGYVLDIDMP